MGVKRGCLMVMVREHEDYKDLYDEVTWSLSSRTVHISSRVNNNEVKPLQPLQVAGEIAAVPPPVFSSE